MSKCLLNEYKLIEHLPNEILSSIDQNKTSLGDNPAIPNIYDIPFLYKVIKNSLNDAREVLLNYGSIDDVSENTIEGVLGHLIKICQEKERPYRDKLEKICYNYVVNTFSIPQETINFKIELVDNVTLSKPFISLEPSEDDDSITFDNVNDAESIKYEVLKRRLLDVLCVGCGLSVAKNVESYINEINEIDKTLGVLYSKILALNTYLLLENGNVDMTEKDPKISGIVAVSMGQKDEQVTIEAQGKIFPILLSEMVKGLMEMFAAHGLPDDKERAKAIIGKSDYLKAEPWDMRLGPALWEILTNSFNDIDFSLVPYLFKRISCLELDNFNRLFNEVFAKTKKGKDLMSILCDKAKNDVEYDRFVDKMKTYKHDKSLINDEFINEDEL